MADEHSPTLPDARSRDDTVIQGPRSFGKYILLAELGSGGMGVVYKARDTQLDRLVALKVLHDAARAGQDTVERFQREARLASQLRHPAIVPILEAGTHEGVPYITMKLIEGAPLDLILDRAAGLEVRIDPAPERLAEDLRARVTLIRDAAEAVAAAHAAGVLHRDLKPGNILVDESGSPWVVDFGLARELIAGSSLTQEGTVVGTPNYMAPEQACGEPVDERADIYGLGSILYHALTLLVPFEADSALTVLGRLQRESVPPPCAAVPDLDRALDLICRKATAHRPADRYPTVAALIEDFDRWLAGEPVSAKPPPVLLDRPPRRRAPLLIGLLVMLAAAAAGVGWHLTRPAQLLCTVPEGAVLEVGGRRFSGPLVALRPGEHTVRVSKPGFRTLTETVRLDRGQTVARGYQLVRQSGTLLVRTGRPGLSIRVTGPIGTRRGIGEWSGKELAPGRYRVDVWGGTAALSRTEVALGDAQTLTVRPRLLAAARWKVQLGELNRDPLLLEIDGDGVPDIVVPNESGRLYALSGKSGKKLWSYAFAQRTTNAGTLGRSLVVIGALRERRLVLIDKVTGKARLKLGTGFAATPALRSAARLVYGDRRGHLRCRTPDLGGDNKLLWTSKHDRSIYRPPTLVDIDGDGGLEVVAITRRTLCVHDLADGRERYRLTLAQGPRNVEVADVDGDGKPEALVSCKDGSLLCIDLRSRKLRWRYRTRGSIYARPTVADLDRDGKPEVVVGSEDGSVYAFDAGSGELRWRHATGEEVHGRVAVGDVTGDGRPEVVAGSDDDRVYLLDGRNGKLIWSFRTRGDVDSDLRLIDIDRDGVMEILACSNDGWAYCLQPMRKN